MHTTLCMWRSEDTFGLCSLALGMALGCPPLQQAPFPAEPLCCFVSSLVLHHWWLPEMRRILFSPRGLKPRALHLQAGAHYWTSYKLEKWESRRSWLCNSGFHLEVWVRGNWVGRGKYWLRVLFPRLGHGGISWSCDSVLGVDVESQSVCTVQWSWAAPVVCEGDAQTGGLLQHSKCGGSLASVQRTG